MKWNYLKKRLSLILLNGDNSLKVMNLRYLPRWIVVLLDIFIAGSSIVSAYFVINNITSAFYTVLDLWQQGVFILLTHVAFFFIYSTYSGVIRHSTFVDIIKIALASFSSLLFIFIVNYAYYYFFGQKIFLAPFLIINMAVTFTGMLSLRVIVKSLYTLFSNVSSVDTHRILIVGVDDDTIAIADAMNTSTNTRFSLEGFISLNKSYGNLKILEKPVFKMHASLFEDIAYLKIDGILFVGDKLEVIERNKLVDLCLEFNLKIFRVPVISEWNEDENQAPDIQKIQIEDLLDRTQISINDGHINTFLKKKTILITGGAGSIGSEIVNQVANYKPKKIIIIDQAESPLHDLELELRGKYPDSPFEFILADIRNHGRIENVFVENKISIVFHAAAYKHVPLIERNPGEAVQVNLFGTKNLADLALKYQVDRFVMVSTDKAVNPTNVMGATKRAAEIYVQSLQAKNESGTRFITTRFGNVLGSNGSVIPYFKKQIENGGPVTVTHQDIIRYFMTIPEACQLVLQAGTMGSGGEVYVFDMGKPVRIMDLAERMIKLSGLVPYKDIDILITGLRPGEKLFEELLIDSKRTVPTHHKKIMIAKDDVIKYKRALLHLAEIEAALHASDNQAMVSALKTLIPEFISQNSVYELLDKERINESV